MDRRSLLKTLAISPFFALGKSSITSMVDSFATDIYLFLHGFFFMEYQDDHLVITAPEVNDHDYQIGRPDKLKPVPPNTTLDWTNLTGQDPCKSKAFPKQILQFSKIDTTVGDLTGPFHFRLVLPCPSDMYAVRRGDFDQFPAIKKGKVWDSLSKTHDPTEKKIALITCLLYQGTLDKYWPSSDTAPYRRHLYAEPHCRIDSLEHTRHAFVDCRRVFANSNAFDLDLNINQPLGSITPKNPSGDDPRLRVAGFDSSDEYSLSEINSAECNDARAINVANCGQYGVLNP